MRPSSLRWSLRGPPAAGGESGEALAVFPAFPVSFMLSSWPLPGPRRIRDTPERSPRTPGEGSAPSGSARASQGRARGTPDAPGGAAV
ncbi:hypothetical protein GCM10010156_45430 [Planobispora rosea]|uniref:Uncharacterized protein n=1 Tax=Planobispora rosea TaxID=35762 RepID=A0A8J3S6Y2_PLARO|nr:hypothetical protein GCM10010156_45430 [Planobispora rosea]GIH86124.1 hypothetical protein Pro02_45320 [Planobispora rosea]